MIHDDPLTRVADSIQNRHRQARVAVIFDLDSTLFCVSPRTQAILRNLGRDPNFNSQFETHAESLISVEVLPSDWGIRSVLTRHSPNAPMEFFKKVRDYWRTHFFSSHYLEHDEIYPSADEYVRHLNDLGAEILYLTGRPESSMRPGTLKALKKFGFPLKEENLLMKPSDVETDEHFKTVALRSLAPQFDDIWFFENEPVIISQVREALPQIRIVFVDSVHSGRENPPADLPAIKMNFSGAWRKSSRD